MLLSKYRNQILAGIILVVALFFRLWHLEFGLPHSFYADEPEIAEIAIKYTYELRDVLQNNNWYKLVPISYVYGAFPSMILTVVTITFSKTMGLLHVAFDKTTLYILMRFVMVLFSISIVFIMAFLAWKKTHNKVMALITAILIALNWKLIVHSHYVNADIIVTTLLCASFLTAFLYYKKELHKDTLYTVLTGLLYGFAVGTKITVLITFPLYLFLFIKKKDYRSIFAFIFLVFGAFAISNPFSIIYAHDFVFRIYEMFFKEAGMVFDSVDYSPLKYVVALATMCTASLLLVAFPGIFNKLNFKRDKTFDWFLVLHIVIYLAFYSIQSRRVDRWLLPIVPIVLMYSAISFYSIKQLLQKQLFYIFIFFIGVAYLIPTATLLLQFQRNTPKSAAYLWMKENTDLLKRKLVYTEEGLDPMGKLGGARVERINVYSGENAQYCMPQPLDLYDYVILSSRPMEHYKNPIIKAKYPFYYDAWFSFENTVKSSGKFTLIKTFPTTTPNLIPLSSVTIWEKNQ